MHVIGTEPDGRQLFRCLEHQAAPAPDHIDLYTAAKDAPAHHFEYFSVPFEGGPAVRQNTRRLPGGRMDPEQRLWILDMACHAFLTGPEESDYLVLKSGTDWCNAVNVDFLAGLVRIQVSPRHWRPCRACGNRPLPAYVVEELRGLGFEAGEPETNFVLAGVAPQPSVLARFVERLFLAVYAEPLDFAVGVRFRHGDIAASFLAELPYRAT